MTESGRQGDSVYLRGWDDYERPFPQAHRRRRSPAWAIWPSGREASRPSNAGSRRSKDSGYDIGWTDGDLGHGPAFLCRDPDGHMIELYYETEWYVAPPELKPALKNQAQRFPARGVNVRRLDHLNCLAADIRENRLFFETYLGCRLTEQIVLDDGTEAGMWMTLHQQELRFRLHPRPYGRARPLPPSHLRAR